MCVCVCLFKKLGVWMCRFISLGSVFEHFMTWYLSWKKAFHTSSFSKSLLWPQCPLWQVWSYYFPPPWLMCALYSWILSPEFPKLSVLFTQAYDFLILHSWSFRQCKPIVHMLVFPTSQRRKETQLVGCLIATERCGREQIGTISSDSLCDGSPYSLAMQGSTNPCSW